MLFKRIADEVCKFKADWIHLEKSNPILWRKNKKEYITSLPSARIAKKAVKV